MKYSMKTIWEARRLILDGRTVADVANKTGMTPSAIYAYTKSERAKAKRQFSYN